MSFETMFNVANMEEIAKISGAGDALIKSMEKLMSSPEISNRRFCHR